MFVIINIQYQYKQMHSIKKSQAGDKLHMDEKAAYSIWINQKQEARNGTKERLKQKTQKLNFKWFCRELTLKHRLVN